MKLHEQPDGRLLTQFEAELRLDEAGMYESMRRRVDSMIMAAQRHRDWGKNKNAGMCAAMTSVLYEIEERMEMAWPRTQDQEGAPSMLGVDMARSELGHYYPLIRKMYDQFAAYRLLEPREVTESTRESALRDANKRDRDHPVVVWAHDDGCTVDHVPNGPNGRRKNCPTQEEWDD